MSSDLEPSRQEPVRHSSHLGWLLAMKLAQREMRHGLSGGLSSGLAGFRIFLLCLILGITAIAAVGSLSASLVAGMAAQGQSILGGDIDFRLLHRTAFPAERDWLKSQGIVSEVATMRAMARYGDQSVLVEAKAVDRAYPLYGGVELDSGEDLSAVLGSLDTDTNNGIYPAVAEQGLYDRLGLSPGARLSFGNIEVEMRAVVQDEPDRTAGGFPLAPRLMVSFEALRAAGLLQPGSLVNYHYRLQLPANTNTQQIALVREVARQKFPQAGWRVRDRSDASPSLRRFIERLGLFLTFVGLTALVVGGIGVGGAISAYVQKRRKTIAIMRALGASGRFVFRIYALQIAALTVFAVIIGVAAGAALPGLVKLFFGTLLPVDLVVQIYPEPLLAAAGFGLFSAAAFALWPLGHIENTPVATLFRDRLGVSRGFPSRGFVIAIAGCFAGLIGLALLISERRDMAFWFILGVAASFLALRGAAALIVWLAVRAGRPRQPMWRMAVSNIIRPNAPVGAVVLSMGMSVTLLSAVAMVDGNINQTIKRDLPTTAPSFFFLDIQPHQVDAFLTLARANKAVETIDTSPILRGQIMAINDVPATALTPAPEAQWVLRGDRGLTYAAAPPRDSDIVEGHWWTPDYDGPPLLSFDADLAHGLGIGLGDQVQVNVLGRPMTGKIANLRKIDWASGGINFVMIFSPHPLASAPHTYLASVSMAAAREASFAHQIVRQYPNISIIRVKEAIETASEILTNIGLAVRAMSVVTLLAGILVLAGAMASGHQARVYDAVVMKVLGATRRRIMLAYALEYALMGLGAAVIAAAAGTLASWALVAGAMQAEWVFLPVTLVLTIISAVALTVILGLIGTYAALGVPAATVLRSE